MAFLQSTTINGILNITSLTGSQNDLVIISTTGSISRTSSTAFIVSGSTNSFNQNGNIFGATAVLGTNDNYAISFITNNTNRLFISNNGNVGIGTTASLVQNSGFTLNIKGDIAIDSDTDPSAVSGGMVLTNNNYRYAGWIAGHTSLSFVTNHLNAGITTSNVAVHIDSSKHVGIGGYNENTPIPSFLSIRTNGSTIPSLTAGYAAAFNILRAVSSATDLVFTISGDTPYIAAIQHRHSNTNGFAYPIAINPLGGNVGIGTTTPITTLDINGTVRIASSLVLSSFTGTQTDILFISTTGSIIRATPSVVDSNLDRYVYGSFKGTLVNTISDYNSVDRTGFYSLSNGTNKPSGVANWTYLQNIRLYDSNNAYHKQISYDTYNNNMWTRTNNNGSWSNWYKMWNEYNHGASSGLDADLLDGQHGSYYQALSTSINTGNISVQSVSYSTTSAYSINSGFANGVTWSTITSKPTTIAGYGITDAFTQNGNSFGATAIIGTNDNQDIVFKTNGVTSMTLAKNGRLGIGTTTPAYTLHIFSTSSNITLYTQNYKTSGDSYAGYFQNSLNTGTGNSYGLYVLNNSSAANNYGIYTTNEGMNYLSGNVGIGITPAFKLHVCESGGSYVAQFEGSSTSVINIGKASLSGGSYIKFMNTSCESWVGLDGSGDTAPGSFNIYTSGSNPIIFKAGVTEKMRILSSGNVGIGTTTPSTRLEIKTAIAPYVAFKISNYSSDVNALYSGVVDNYGSYIGSGYYSNSYLYKTLGTDAVTLRFDGGVFRVFTNIGLTANVEYAPTERMTITSIGRVGIGNNIPLYKLDVNGSVRVGNDAGASQLYLKGFAGSGQYIYFDDGAVERNWQLVGGTDFNLFGNNGATRILTANANGNVGIGTSSPSYKFVSKTSSDGSISTVSGAFRNSSTYGDEFIISNLSGESRLTATWETSGVDSNMTFRTTTAAGTQTEKMRITAAGNVGIGVIAPDASLHVNGATINTDRLALSTDGVNTWRFRHTNDNTDSLAIGNDVGGTFATRVMTLARSGNVGIGTTSPDYPLSVTGVINAQEDQSATDVAYRINGSGILGKTTAGNFPSTTGYTRFIGAGIVFSAKNDNTIQMTIAPTTGNVGIGTTNPTKTLDVAGTGRFISAYLPLSSFVTTSGNDITQFGMTGATNNPYLAIRPDETNKVISLRADGSAAYPSLTFQTGGSERLRIDTAGNVGIGTTPTATLHIVNGSATINLNNKVGFYGYFSAALAIQPITSHAVGVLVAANVSDQNDTTKTIFRVTDNTYATPWLNIIGGGNVGIGTATPSSVLHISGNQSRLRIQNSVAGSTFNGIEFVDYLNNANASILSNQTTGEIRYTAAASYYPTFYSNNALAMSIDNSRNIILTNGMTFTQSGGNGFIRFNRVSNTNGNDDLLVGYHMNNKYHFSDYNTSTKGMSIDTVNNIVDIKGRLTVATAVGIGVANTVPVYTLDVSGGVVGAANFTVPSYNTLLTSNYLMLYGANGGGMSADSVGNLSIGNFASSTLNTRVYISNTGSVGIGTTSPSTSLYINKSVAGDNLIVTNVQSSANNWVGLSIRYLNTEYFSLKGNVNTGELRVGGINPSGYYTTIYSNGNETMRISSGKVSIGGINPSYHLHVVSGAAISGSFDGRVIGVDAVNSNEFTTLGQLPNYGNVTNRNTFLITDWNQTTYQNTHFLSSESGATNSPTTDYTYGMQLSFHRSGAAYRTQLVSSLYGTNELWVRNSKDSDVWSSWTRIVTNSGTWNIGITGFANGVTWSNITSKPTTLSGYGITDNVVYSTASYANPTWITSLAGTKITGVVGTATFATTASALTSMLISQFTNNSGYLTTQTSHADVVVDGDFTSQGIMLRGGSSGVYSILTDNSSNWNTAFGWGDHTAANYTSNTRTLTINGIIYDLTTDRSWSVGDLISSSSYANPTWITSLAGTKITGNVGTASYATVALNSTFANGVTWSNITSKPTTIAGFGISDAFIKDGNSFGDKAVLGTNDTQLLSFKTNNLARVTIAATANRMGIGTTSPLYTLDVVSADSIASKFNGRIIGVTAINSNELTTLGQIRYVVVEKSDNVLYTDVTNVSQTYNLMLSSISSGTTHSNVFHANSITYNPFTGVLTVPSISATSYLGLTGGGGGSTNSFNQNGNTFGVTASIGTIDNKALNFITNNTVKMTIDTTGFIGIGNTNPSYSLDIRGNLRVGGLTASDNFIKIGAGRSSNGYAYIDLVGDTTYNGISAAAGFRIIRSNNGANAATDLQHAGTGNFNITNNHAADMIFKINNTEKVKINSTGITIQSDDSFQSTGTLNIKTNANNPIVMKINGTETTRFDENGILVTSTTPPSTNPASGTMYIYLDANGYLKAKGSNGTITTLATP